MRGFMLAGISSNVGKTTVTMGIMSAIKNRDLSVVPFKTGPDYIDPMFHTFVTGVKSTNLDTWMLDSPTVKLLFNNKLEDNSIAIVEGVMGLYDGHGSEGDVGSSAYLSKQLELPVFLIIDGRGMARSAAALVKGYAQFDSGVNLAGVIINKISSPSHYKLLKHFIEVDTGVPCVGYFPNSPDIVMNSRHLGLIPVDELVGLREQVDKAAVLAEEYIDLDKILELSGYSKPAHIIKDPFDIYRNMYEGITIAYAKDKAFSFYYEDNFNALKILGVKMIPFSPLEDNKIPENVDAVYLGGGFPEIFAQKLEENRCFISSFKNALEEGLPCFAECGGLMYLTESITDTEGNSYAQVGVIKAKTRMTKSLRRFGYVDVVAQLGEQRIKLKAHEFHHSELIEIENFKMNYAVSKKDKNWRCGLCYKNTLAGYAHVHFYSNPEFLLALLERVKVHKTIF